MNFWKRLLAPLRPHPMAAIVAQTDPRSEKAILTTAVVVSETKEAQAFEASERSTDAATNAATNAPAQGNRSARTAVPTQDEPDSSGEVRRYFEETVALYADRDVDLAVTFASSGGRGARGIFEQFVAEQDAKEAAELAASGHDERDADDAYGTLSLSLGFGPGQDDLARKVIENAHRLHQIDDVQAKLFIGIANSLTAEGQTPTAVEAEIKQKIRTLRSDSPRARSHEKAKKSREEREQRQMNKGPSMGM